MQYLGVALSYYLCHTASVQLKENQMNIKDIFADATWSEIVKEFLTTMIFFLTTAGIVYAVLVIFS